MKIVSQKEFGYGVCTEYRDKRYPTSWIVMQIKKALINDRADMINDRADMINDIAYFLTVSISKT